jgi:long-subunit fatty acid transport protein
MKAAPIILVVFISVQSLAQDTHYWTYRFGTRAVLMGGPAVGGIEDNSSVIYNPALLSLVKSTSISLNANVYQVMKITAKDGAGQGQDVTSNQFSAVPVTVSGLIKRKQDRWKLGYAIVVPNEFTFKATARDVGSIDIVGNTESPGAEDYVGQFTINSRLSENLGAFAVAFKVNDHWSIGLTNQIIYRSHTYTKLEMSRVILNNAASTLVSTSETQNIEYTNLRYVAKIGIAFSSGKWSAGATLNLPSLNLTGSGTIARDINANNLQTNIEKNPKKPPVYVRADYAVNDRQTNLATEYHTPLSVAGGLAYKGERTLLAVSAEWFSSVSLYNIMTPIGDPFTRPVNLLPSDNNFLTVNASNKSVFNISLGLEQTVSERLSLSAGFRTNYSFYDNVYDQRIDDRNKKNLNSNALNLDISSWNIYHGVIGGTLKQERRDISIGINFSWSENASIKQFANFDKPTEGTFLLGQKLPTHVDYIAYGLILGYTFRVRAAD